MSVASTLTRVLLVATAALLMVPAVKYMTGVRDGTLNDGPLGELFVPSVFEGPGLAAFLPFGAVAYLHAAAMNVIAATCFDSTPAALVLLVFAVVFNLGMAALRTQWMDQALYLPGAAEKASRVQGAVGAVCAAAAVATLLTGGAKPKEKAA
eukprot:TRINITY_DN8667_c0_g1_i1.p1 TRINITY_DN8667_c0_g1~~TRINITY_DN8667_c0_g1_i1.p1  ORF type:complete len:152 (+),score=48.88 TRINITY_DN8667_c0_g1_i1:146-601(+)